MPRSLGRTRAGLQPQPQNSPRHRQCEAAVSRLVPKTPGPCLGKPSRVSRAAQHLLCRMPAVHLSVAPAPSCSVRAPPSSLPTSPHATQPPARCPLRARHRASCRHRVQATWGICSRTWAQTCRDPAWSRPEPHPCSVHSGSCMLSGGDTALTLVLASHRTPSVWLRSDPPRHLHHSSGKLSDTEIRLQNGREEAQSRLCNHGGRCLPS